MSLTATILGCGSSTGVPRPALGWGKCDPNNPKNRRRRCSLLVEQRSDAGVTRVLVDTSPDLREQLLAADVDWLDAVVFTHEHADHTHGIDDLRSLVIHRRRRIDTYVDAVTSRALHARFGYCFVTPPGSEYPPLLIEHRLEPGQALVVEGQGGALPVLPFLQQHGDMPSIGFRFGPLAYSCDLNGLPDESVAVLEGLDLWILDALREAPHPSHLSLAESLAWIERLKPRRAVLTNLHSDLDYEWLRTHVPANVQPAYDGLRLEL